jgi:hypothetical protein
MVDARSYPSRRALARQGRGPCHILLSTRHPIFRYPLEEPCELLANLLLASGLLLKYCRDWRRAGRPAV